MPNMSYCRFSNTLSDLRDCYNALLEDGKPLSKEEEKAKDKLIDLCIDLVELDKNLKIENEGNEN
jgi:hypothetical protein